MEGNAETAQEAVARATTGMKAVVATLRRTGLVEIGVPTTMMVGDNPALRGYPAGQLPRSRIARAVVRVVAARPEALVQAVALAIDNGAKGVSSFAFESSAADSARRAVLKEAVAAGRQEAELLAREMGGRLGALLGLGSGGAGPSSSRGLATPSWRLGHSRPGLRRVDGSSTDTRGRAHLRRGCCRGESAAGRDPHHRTRDV